MSVPYRVQLGFGSTWQTNPASVTWTTVTGYVADRRQPVSIRRGASAAFGEVDPAHLTLTLLNADRRFDPAESSSPYAGNLVGGVPIRVQADPANNGTWPATVFYGFVKSWPQRFSRADGFLTVPLEAYDGFAKLATADAPNPVAALAAGALYVSFPMGDDSPAWTTPDGTTGTYKRPPTAQTITTRYGVNHLGTSFDGNQQATVPVAYLGVLMVAQVDLSAVAANDYLTLAEHDDAPPPGGIGLGSPTRHMWLGIKVLDPAAGTGQLVRRTISLAVGGGFEMTERRATVTLDLTAPISVGWGDDGPFSFTRPFWYNGEVVTWGTPDAAIPDTTGRLVGRFSIGGSTRQASQWPGFKGTIAAVLTNLSGSVSTLNDLAETYHAAAIEGRTDETTGTRLGWLLDTVGWPVAARSIATGRSRCGAMNTDGVDALGYARRLADTEAGRLFVSPTGTLTFHDRWRRWLDSDATTPQINVTDATGIYFQDLDRDPSSMDLMVNRATVTRDGGSPQTRTDSASIASHGEQGRGYQTAHHSDRAARALAEFTINTRGQPLDLIPRVRLPFHGMIAADITAVLGVDLGDRINLRHEVRGVGDPVDTDWILEGVRHVISGAGTEWWCELFLAPAPTRSVFVIGTSEIGSADVITY